MMLAMPESSSGAACAAATKRSDHLGRGGQHQHAAVDVLQLVQAELQPGDHAEVATAAADGPEEIGVRLGAQWQLLSIGRDDLGGQQVVDGEAVLADQVAHAPAQRQAANAHGAGVAEAGGQAVHVRGQRCTRRP